MAKKIPATGDSTENRGDAKPSWYLDPMERRLMSQMTSAHEAAMVCFSRAASATSYPIHDRNMMYAVKLMTIFARQMETLNKHRGKGQQKVTVEHVHVERGGQAMVGNVTIGAHTPSSAGQSKDAPKEVTHAPAAAFEMTSETPVAAEPLKKPVG